jgi:hypothetical protein
MRTKGDAETRTGDPRRKHDLEANFLWQMSFLLACHSVFPRRHPSPQLFRRGSQGAAWMPWLGKPKKLQGGGLLSGNWTLPFMFGFSGISFGSTSPVPAPINPTSARQRQGPKCPPRGYNQLHQRLWRVWVRPSLGALLPWPNRSELRNYYLLEFVHGFHPGWG